MFPLRGQVRQHLPHLHFVARLWPVGRQSQNAGINGFNVLGRFFAFQRKQEIARPDLIAVVLQPADEDAFVHRPAEAGNGDGNGHGRTAVLFVVTRFSGSNETDPLQRVERSRPAKAGHYQLRHSSNNSTIARSISSTWGTTAFSSVGLYGVGVKAPWSRRIGASRSLKPASATRAAISAPRPKGANASSTIRSLPVLRTD